MRGVFAFVGLLLLSMGRTKVDPAQAQKAVDAVRSGQTSVRGAAEAYGLISRNSLHSRVTNKVAIDAKPDPGTVLSKEDGAFVEDVVVYASRHFLLLGRRELKDAIYAEDLPRRAQGALSRARRIAGFSGS
ncbi:unnamed protein product [Ectocarpus sp. CCAP 1310/34]|nr:unnamed protein product [Ectocarpus sp. CCAP 1310/34]